MLNWYVDCDCVKQPQTTKNIDPSSGPRQFDEDTSVMNGWYSQKAADTRGYTIYMEAETGKEVPVTSVSRNQTSSSCWEDEKFAGFVTKYVRSVG